jgi:flagellar FliL protein
MAKKKKASDTDEEETEGGSKKRTLLIGAAVVALAAGGYLFTSGGGSADAAAGESAEAPALVPGAVVALEPITLNLADGRFLKVGIALQLVEGVAAPAPAEVEGFAAPALDEAISLLGSLSYPDLVAPGGRDAAKASLSERIGARYEGDVMDLYFTELVMQ